MMGKLYIRIDSLLIGKVAEDIVNKKVPTNLIISIYPLRYDTGEQYLNLLLQMGMGGVLIVGICGSSGMGKTEIAKSIYEQISCKFEGSCFLPNVDRNSRRPNGLVRLQKTLLSDILSEKNVQVMNCDRGMEMIEENLRFKRVLIVLDDVDELQQLYALVGSRSWFGLGSKIIVTTRRLHLLNVLGVDQVFLAQGLPLPLNIKVIWQQYQQSSRLITGLKEYIQALHQLTLERQIYLRTRLLKERQKNAIQAQIIADLEQPQRGFELVIEHK